MSNMNINPTTVEKNFLTLVGFENPDCWLLFCKGIKSNKCR
jgi:hypothetical protein